MIRRPPRSTLFPYTTALPISYSSGDPESGSYGIVAPGHPRIVADRSEEHTSELQSRRDLVCRLLLEKKKKNEDKNKIHILEKGVDLLQLVLSKCVIFHCIRIS